MSRGRGTGAVVVAGAVARRQWAGGHVWAILHWVLAFRRLGWAVTFLDHLDEGGGGAPEETRGFLSLMRRFGLEEDACLSIGGGRTVGLSRDDLLKRARASDLLLNVMGYCTDDDVLGGTARRVFLDIDPGFGQMWKALGQADVFQGHDVFVTVGGNVGRPDCAVPTCGLRWIPTLPPVVLELWPESRGAGREAFTSVASWRGPFDAVEYEGARFGLRVHEFRRFFTLPGRTGLPFEVALDIGPADAGDRDRLLAEGWRLVSPRAVAGGPEGYRDYVASSGAEFQVAKHMYVAARTGWFSDRTACYLASGRPAVVQDTGLDGVIETGAGLLRYADLDEAAAATAEIAGDRTRHARAARALAEARLDSDRVLGELLPRIAAA